MRDFVILFVHVLATLVRLLRPGGLRSVVAESVLAKQQLLILNRSRHEFATRNSQHDSPLITDKVEERNSHRARITRPALIHRAFGGSRVIRDNYIDRVSIRRRISKLWHSDPGLREVENTEE